MYSEFPDSSSCFSGTWLECDDLQGSYCSKHERFGVPPSEVHIVIWERKPLQVTKELNLQLQKRGAKEGPLQKAETNSPGKQLGNEATDTSPVLCHTEDFSNAHSNEAHNLVGSDKVKPLSGFKNLADDEIMLTLVDVALDSSGKLEDDNVTENRLVTETLQQQDPGGVVFPLSKNTHAPLHRGQPSTANTSVMPALSPSNNYSPKPLPVQITLVQNNANPVQESSSLGPGQIQSNISRTKPLSSRQEMPNALQHTRGITASSKTAAPNRSSQLPCQNRAKPFVTSWMKGLHGRNPYMPKSLLANSTAENSPKPLQKPTIPTPLVKGPAHFGGFVAKHSERTLKKLEKRAVPSLPPAGSLVANHPVEKNALQSEGNVSKIPVTSIMDKEVQPNPNHGGNKNLTAVENAQLRIQLRQVCKNAVLKKQVNAQARKRSSTKKSIEGQSQLGSQEESDSLQSLLRDLQHHIEVEDSKSERSLGTTMSQCSSDDILSELLSPATTPASPELPMEEECKYLEMGSCRIESPISSEKAESARYLDRNYCIPEKEGLCGSQPDILGKKSPLHKFIFESPTKQNNLEELPFSELDSIMDSDEVVHHFDESLIL